MWKKIKKVLAMIKDVLLLILVAVAFAFVLVFKKGALGENVGNSGDSIPSRVDGIRAVFDAARNRIRDRIKGKLQSGGSGQPGDGHPDNPG